MSGELIDTGISHTSPKHGPAALTDGLEQLRRIIEDWATDTSGADRLA
jgi:hypothetical protein